MVHMYSVMKITPKRTHARFVQVKNPRTLRYVKIDRSGGKIIGHKKDCKPYKGIPII